MRSYFKRLWAALLGRSPDQGLHATVQEMRETLYHEENRYFKLEAEFTRLQSDYDRLFHLAQALQREGTETLQVLALVILRQPDKELIIRPEDVQEYPLYGYQLIAEKDLSSGSMKYRIKYAGDVKSPAEATTFVVH